ncbi:MAG TPA: VOC family protein [Verrucomicrobiae bacterium]|nr:VOC family protein [Verrucomicrobiae bacterium]
MANIDHYPPGSFCWFELGTSDQNAAKPFYHALFGWGANDLPMGPDMFYSMFTLDSRSPGAAYTLMPDMVKAGIPPHWAIYIASANVDESTAKVTAAGGSVIKGPFDVFDVGRMSVVRDPTGAVFQIWQEKRPQANGIGGVPGTVCWADLNTRDVSAASKFYTAVFGWEIAPGEHDTSGYLHIKNGEQFIGGIPPSHMIPPHVPPHWLLYFLVADADASTAKVTELGGKVIMPAMSLEKVGRFSVVADPQGAVFSLFQPDQH